MEIKANIMDDTAVARALKRVSHEIIERNDSLENVVLIGIKSRGIPLAGIIAENVKKYEGVSLDVGELDISLYRDDLAEYDRLKGTDDEISLPDFDMKCEALLPLFDKEHPLKAHFHCHRADDIFTAVRLSEEFGLDYVLIHCTDGAVIAEELAEEKPAIVLGPIFGDRGKPELANHDISTPAVLAAQGLKFALCTDHPETPIQYLPLTAALAVRGGLSREEALRCITINAAETLGAADRTGSVEVGKDADFTLFTGDPLDIMTTPELTVIRGAVAYRKPCAY